MTIYKPLLIACIACVMLLADQSTFATSVGKYSLLSVMGPSSSQRKQPDYFPSLDGQAVVLGQAVDGYNRWFLQIKRRKIFLRDKAWPFPEFLWSPDSKALAVTFSDGGSVGNFHVNLYLLARKQPEILDFATSVVKDFLAHYLKCFEPELPNIAAVSWLNGSKRLLIAAEVLPDSNCDDMGTFSLYEVSVPEGQIIKKYSQIEAKHKFKNVLGPELMSADDACFKIPGYCDIPELHKPAKFMN